MNEAKVNEYTADPCESARPAYETPYFQSDQAVIIQKFKMQKTSTDFLNGYLFMNQNPIIKSKVIGVYINQPL